MTINELFPDKAYTESAIYEIAEANQLQVADTPMGEWTILEVVQCNHGFGRDEELFECNLASPKHTVLGEFRNNNNEDLFTLTA